MLSSRRIIDENVIKKALQPDIGLTKPQKKLSFIINVTFFIPIIYSVFLPLKPGTAWFYVGLTIYLLGVIIGTIAAFNFFSTPVDELVIKGAYRISRNPMYLSMFLIFVGTGIACVSWIFLLLAIAFLILSHILVNSEESFCLQKYGNAYREYMNTTPRWVGMPKSGEKR
ncbi:MAG: isoprenylcysteine carboxylmethyltransferase family protein [Methanocellales archaeon]|nr:isoprenylcysteine carboxylmethyltransferase family protein [Methanocellales archaeon]MDD3291997.1 isoprenylcysteine carboxylmethyltransferase family protein [Methanocellales archaeon]MDD5235893.1 isoprenylcysteine carboxylmethyltransferase family protein [Methanocellales archaeon]MDD5485448.1 isoprenylcysteine carboxylmethyltransferase family protein [Methanocellales archaeon]